MSLPNLIIGALKGQNNDERRRAQGLLIQMRQRNTQGFFFQCSQLISDQKNDQFIRQSAGTVLGNSAITKHPGTGQYLWDLLSNDVKGKIKDNLLNTLISKDLVAMKAGANAIAQISAIQIPRGQWLDLVDSLGQNSMNQDFNFKNASIVTIGFMCQQFNKIGVKVNKHTGQQFIGSIIIGSRDTNSSIVATSIAALRNSLVFLDQILQSKQVRDQSFKIISLHIADERHVRGCYQALFEFVKVCYSYLGEYLDFLLSLTLTHLNSRNDNTILALQLWDTIGDEYLSLLQNQRGRIKDQKGINNYMQAYSQKMLPQVMKCMLIHSSNDLQFPQMRQSTLKTLESFVQACDKSVVDKITQGVNYTINSTNPGERQASTLLFAALCVYPDKKYIENCFKNGFDHLYKLFSDSETVVVRNTLNGFTKLFQVFPDVPRNHKKIGEIVDLMINFAQSPDEDVCISSLTALAYLTEKLTKQEPNPINTDPSVLLTKIVKFFDANQMKFHQKMKQANEKLVIIIMNIIVGMDNRQTIIQLLEFMLNKYQNLLKLKVKFNDYLQAVEKTTCILHTIILTLRLTVPNPLMLNKICELIHLHVKQLGVDAECLSLTSAVTVSFTKLFQQRLDQFWLYITAGLQKTNDHKIFKTALTCIGDFARNFQTNFAQKGTEVLSKLIKYIKQPIQRQQKINILACLGDLIIGLKSHIQIFLDDLLNIIDLFFAATYQLMSKPSQHQYVQQLKEALLDMYACLIFALNNSKKPNQKLFRHYKSFAYFVVRTCDKSFNPTVQYLKNCLYTIYDAAAFYYSNEAYRRDINEIIESNQIGNLIDIVKTLKHKPQMNQLLLYITQRGGMR